MPLLPPFSAGSREWLQVPTFRNSIYLDPQVGLTRNLRVHQLDTEATAANNNINAQKRQG
jgi:hypothetical protein